MESLTTKTNNLKDRILFVDCLNIAACIGVIWMHCTNADFNVKDGAFSLFTCIGIITHSISFWPVPVFMMITGYNCIGYKKDWKYFFKRRVQRTLIPFIAWSIIYYIFAHDGNIESLHDFFQAFLNGKIRGHMWFFVPLFTIYITMPFISVFAINATPKILLYFQVFSFVFVSIIPFIFGILEIEAWKNTLFPWGTTYIMYALAGYMLKVVEIPIKCRKIIYIAGTYR